MEFSRICMIGLLAGAAVLAGSAEPRGPSASSRPGSPAAIEARHEQLQARKTAEIDAWLRRLVGRFRYEGFYAVVVPSPAPPPPIPVKGMADCIGIGGGPGLQCVVNALWDDERWGGKRFAKWGGGWVTSDSPALLLYGIDPLASKVSYLQVDHRGIAQDGSGLLNGDTLSYRERWVNPPEPVPIKERIVRIHAPARGDVIHISVELVVGYEPVFRIDLDLHRVPQRPAGR